MCEQSWFAQRKSNASSYIYICVCECACNVCMSLYTYIYADILRETISTRVLMNKIILDSLRWIYAYFVFLYI